MNDEQKELFRHSILLQLEAASPSSLPLVTLWQGIKARGFRVHSEEIEKDLGYLVGKGLVVETRGELSRGLARYELSAAGRDYLEERGLA